MRNIAYSEMFRKLGLPTLRMRGGMIEIYRAVSEKIRVFYYSGGKISSKAYIKRKTST